MMVGLVTGLTISVVAILFMATVVRTALGFGEALVAVPLLALAIPVTTAAPVAVLVSITVAAVVVARDWRLIHVRSAAHLLLATLVGAPLGLLLLALAPAALTKALLGLVIMSVSGYFLASPARGTLASDRSAWMFGFGAGVLGGAYGMNGPPLAIYGTLRGWRPDQFRATLQGYFLPASIVVMVGYWYAGLWTPAVTAYYLVALPWIAVAIVVGRLAARRVPVRSFVTAVHGALVVIGLVLLTQAALAR
jgi:uncharacterized membrane protein YfcA